MSIEEEIAALRRYLDELARASDDELIERYELRRPPMPQGFYWRLRWLAGWVVRVLKSVTFWRTDPWPVTLRQAANTSAKPLLIWAIGTDRETLRAACAGLCGLPISFAPVLITDVTDFAFFSRLGWLVEYVPQLSGDGESYAERKLKFLARLYRDVPALPATVGLHMKCPLEDIPGLLG